MTNYINTEILCEAYTKLDIDIFHDKVKLGVLHRQLVGFFEERAKFSFGDDVVVRVEFEEGSLITKLTVVGGAVAAIATAVAQYGSFRDGVSQIAADATVLAHSANYEVTFRTKTPFCDRIDAERRKGIFGRVDALIGSLDIVHTKLRQDALPRNPAAILEFNRAVDELLRWEASTDRFFAKITDQATISCLAEGLLKELDDLPKQPLWVDQMQGESLRTVVAKSNSSNAANLAAVAARMEETVRAIKKSMRRRIGAPQSGVA